MGHMREKREKIVRVRCCASVWANFFFTAENEGGKGGGGGRRWMVGFWELGPGGGEGLRG